MAPTADPTQPDVIDLVQRDHQEIKAMMQRVASDGAGKADAFEALVAKLAAHETAEEEIVHPLARKNGSDQMVDARLEEESKGKTALAELEKMGVDAPQFDMQFEQVRKEVLQHADHEEREEHPQLRANADAEQLQRAGKLFQTAEAAGPTHAHAHSPESATGNMLVGTFVAVADRVRDALRNARD